MKKKPTPDKAASPSGIAGGTSFMSSSFTDLMRSLSLEEKLNQAMHMGQHPLVDAERAKRRAAETEDSGRAKPEPLSQSATGSASPLPAEPEDLTKHSSVLDLLEKAEANARRFSPGDAGRLADILHKKAKLLSLCERDAADGLFTHLNEAQNLFRSVNDYRQLYEVNRTWAEAAWHHRSAIEAGLVGTDGAFMVLDDWIGWARSSGNREELAEALFIRATTHASMGTPQEKRVSLERAMSLAKELEQEDRIAALEEELAKLPD